MRIWVLQNERGHDPEGLEACLRLSLPDVPSLNVTLECHLSSSSLLGSVRRLPPDLIVAAPSTCPDLLLLGEVLANEVGLILATTSHFADSYRGLAERYPVHLVPLPVQRETLSLALWTAAASHARQLRCSRQLAQLHQRLHDRILVERAKGVLVHQLGITEEDAYQRMRVHSRRHRRPLREIAQAILDTQLLLQSPQGDSLPPRNADAMVHPATAIPPGQDKKGPEPAYHTDTPPFYSNPQNMM